jgi:hypothetical protein
MKNKSNSKNWDEVKLAIATLSVTSMLGVWNLFSSIDHNRVLAQVVATQIPALPTPTEVVATQIPLPTSTSSIIYFTQNGVTTGSTTTTTSQMPTVQKPNTVVVEKPSKPQKKSSEPKAVAKTSSSK